MKKFFIYLCVFILSGMTTAFAQNADVSNRSEEQLDEDIIYNSITVLRRDGAMISGRIFGFKNDTLIIGQKEGVKSVSVFEIESLTIDGGERGSRYTLMGMVFGLYAGNLLLSTDKGWDATFLRYYSEYDLLFGGLISIVAGGTIGTFMDLAAKKQKNEFRFSADTLLSAKELRKLKKFLSAPTGHKSKIRLSFFMSKVDAQFHQIRRENYVQTENFLNIDWGHHQKLTSINLLRRIAVTYEFSDNIEAGLAMNFFGEPPSYTHIDEYTRSIPYQSLNTDISRKYIGKGYYAAVMYNPFRQFFSGNGELLVGGGPGFSYVDYELTTELTTRLSSSASSTTVKTSNEIKKWMASGFVVCEFRYRTTSGINLSAQADYIYLPEKLSAIPEFRIGEMRMGGFGFGIGLGLSL